METTEDKTNEPLLTNFTGSASSDVITPLTMLSDLAKSCHPCLIDETDELASSFCVDCVEYLCSSCNRDHRKNKLTRGHRLLEELDMLRDPTPFSKMKELMLCSDHRTSEVAYKCEDHDQFICVTCIAVGHRKCERVIELAKCCVYESLHEKFKTLQNRTAECKTFRKRSLENILLNQDKVLRESTEFAQKVVQNLLQIDEKLKLEIKELVEAKCKQIEIHVENCEHLEQETNSCLHLLSVVEKFSNTEQLVVLSNHLMKKAEQLGRENMNYADRAVETIKFEKNSLLEGIETLGKVLFLKATNSSSRNQDTFSPSSDQFALKEGTKSSQDYSKPNDEFVVKEDTKTLPDLSLTCKGRSDDEFAVREKTKSSQDFPLTSKKNANNELALKAKAKSLQNIFLASNSKSQAVGKIKAQHQVSLLQQNIKSSSFAYSVRTSTDETKCFVTGFAKLNDKLVVIDRNNVKLKVFNEDNTLLCECIMPGDPLDICSTGKHTCIAIVVDNIRLINVYEVTGNSVFKLRHLCTKRFPLSIAAKSDWDSYVLFSEQPCVALEDRQILEIEQRNLNDGKIFKIFNVYEHMSLDNVPDTYRIHYTCKGKIVVSEYQKFFTFVDDGKDLVLQWFYKSHGMKHLYNISDIESDEEGNVYVCGVKSKNVHQVWDKNNFNSRCFSCTSAGKPSALFFDRKQNRLLVAMQNEDKIWVIQF